MRRRLLVIVAAVLLVVGLAGCAAGAGEPETASMQSDGPPAGGWPQAVDGRVTDEMCGLLTENDYAKFGHTLLPSDSAGRVTGGNAVSCSHMTGDEFVLDLQPTAAAATILYAGDLAEQARRMKEQKLSSELISDVVAGADESWFDLSWLSASAEFKEYELRLRRGALVITLHLGAIKDASAKDPKDTLVGLALLVLNRAPTLGSTDTGVTPVLRYQVTGTGRAASITYTDPSLLTSKKLTNVPLPWSVDVPMASRGANPVMVGVTARAASSTAMISCAMSVNGTSIGKPQSTLRTATCGAEYTEPTAATRAPGRAR